MLQPCHSYVTVVSQLWFVGFGGGRRLLGQGETGQDGQGEGDGCACLIACGVAFNKQIAVMLPHNLSHNRQFQPASRRNEKVMKMSDTRPGIFMAQENTGLALETRILAPTSIPKMETGLICFQ